MAKYIQKGNTIDYTAASAIKAGEVVSLATRVGVAAGDIPANAVGALSVEGVFEIDKTASLAISIGDAVYFSTTTNKITKTNTDVPAGWAVAAAAADATVVRVKIG